MQIGATLREKRRGAGITLQEVARETGLSKSFISQVEVGAANPSIASLKQIADVLGLPLATIFASVANEAETETPHPGVSVVRAERRKLLMPPLPAGAMYLLSPEAWGKMEVIMAEFQPGYDTGEEMYTHQGEECGLVLTGTLETTVGEAIYMLEAGDSIYFLQPDPPPLPQPWHANRADPLGEYARELLSETPRRAAGGRFLWDGDRNVLFQHAPEPFRLLPGELIARSVRPPDIEGVRAAAVPRTADGPDMDDWAVQLDERCDIRPRFEAAHEAADRRGEPAHCAGQRVGLFFVHSTLAMFLTGLAVHTPQRKQRQIRGAGHAAREP